MYYVIVSLMMNLNTQLNFMNERILNMIVFDKFKTGDPIKDSIITTLILTLITCLFQYANYYFTQFMYFMEDNFNLNIFSIFRKRNIVEYNGKITLSRNFYTQNISQTSVFSDRFRALCEYIVNNIGENNSINVIKEYAIDKIISSNIYHTDKINSGIYMVTQKDTFLISKELDIYAYIIIKNESDNKDDGTNNQKKPSDKIENITIQLYSYKNNINVIKMFVDDITNKYLSSIDECRQHKRYIYTLVKTKFEESPLELWDEVLFSSTRTFDNIFFEGKQNVISKIDFFLNNKDWYYEKGIPYTLGFGLYGPPGTGKTSLIKAVANYTKRNVIIISFKLIKKKTQLDAIFFESRYNEDNRKNSILFDKKIIVFEDIDCIGDIVKDRCKKKTICDDININANTDNLDNNLLSASKLIETMAKVEKAKTVELLDEDHCNLITLDDILNLWDGIRETPGRIMFITSNHYKDLDPALTRPGRIDIPLELTYSTRQTISDMYHNLFNEYMSETDLNLINDKYYTPAEVINIYMNEERDKDRFIKRLQKNER